LAAFVLTTAGASAATIKVTTTGDPDNGTGQCATGGSCSLREAINQADADASGDKVSIPAGTYRLTLSTELTISASMTLDGAGARTTTVKQTVGGQNVLAVTGGTVTVRKLTVTGGHVAGGGGGISNGGALTLEDSEVTGNEADGRVSLVTHGGSGGGIASSGGGSLTVIRSTIDKNVARGIQGASGAGGGILSITPITVINSTIAGNSVEGGPGSGLGGGVFVAGSAAQLTLSNTTVAFNHASGGGGGQGGNLYVSAGAGGTARNAIIADGTASAGSENCFGALQSQGNNLEDRNQCGLNGPTDVHPANALLGAPQDNGGPMDTVALLSGSPAINAGNPNGCTDPSSVPIATDERGVPRPQGKTCDIGAFEFRIPSLKGSPKISGKPRAGDRLTCRLPAIQSPDGQARITVTWLRKRQRVGTGKAYTVKPPDVGRSLRCRVVATNSASSASATSRAVSIPTPSVAITASDLHGRRATFHFKTHNATGAQCALVAGHRAPHYSPCSSPKTYRNLKSGRYTFFVRALQGPAKSAPVKSSFDVS
jgi:CSLREA domain-containing protein